MSAAQQSQAAGDGSSGISPRWPVSSCTAGLAGLYVDRALDREGERAFELHYMECVRCLEHVERARALEDDRLRRGRPMNVGRAWRAAFAARTTDAEYQWYRRRLLQIARDAVLGATLKAAGAKAGVSDERARQILVHVQCKVLALASANPLPTDDLSTASMRKHAAWWCARFDELAALWGISGEESVQSDGKGERWQPHV